MLSELLLLVEYFLNNIHSVLFQFIFILFAYHKDISILSFKNILIKYYSMEYKNKHHLEILAFLIIYKFHFKMTK